MAVARPLQQPSARAQLKSGVLKARWGVQEDQGAGKDKGGVVREGEAESGGVDAISRFLFFYRRVDGRLFRPGSR